MELKKRFERIERDETIEVHEDENAHLWAVSYSDFLMALLSFFILFFSVDDDKKDQLILQIAKNFSEHAGNSGAMAEKTQPQVAERMPTSLLEELKKYNVQVSDNKKNLTINFPDNIFPVGKYNIESTSENTISQVLELLKPHSEKLYFYFEGHSDSTPSHKKISKLAIDNYVLSSLRATQILHKAVAMGFPEENLFVQAASSHIRNSRSISLRVSQKGVEL